MNNMNQNMERDERTQDLEQRTPERNRPRRKKQGFLRRMAALTLSAVLFGTVSAGTFYGVNALLSRKDSSTASVSADSAAAALTSLASTSYINMSMFFAFAMLYPDAIVLLLIIPVKIKYLAWFFAALFAVDILISLFSLSLSGVLLPIVALLNFFIFFANDLLAWIRRMTGRTAHRASPKTIHYKKAVKEQMKDKGYHHKCAVCGKTDTDYPDLEFRYCSKCNGYYCYCSEHINNHIHITNAP